jgi:hypothetical protein
MPASPSRPLIIALGGMKRSGKDTFAGILAAVAKARPNLTPHRIAFADPLRQATAAAYALEGSEDPFGDELKDTVDPSWGITRRQMLINVGEAMRGVDADHWTKLLTRGIDSFVTAARRYTPTQRPLHIVTDMRRPNEAKALLDLGATLVLVVRDGVVWDDHETEAMAGMATGRYLSRWRRAAYAYVQPQFPRFAELFFGGAKAIRPYHLVVENAFPVDGDASMIPAAMAAFEKAANQLIDAVLSTARG